MQDKDNEVIKKNPDAADDEIGAPSGTGEENAGSTKDKHKRRAAVPGETL